jgi:hypothetical protein
MKIFNKNNTFRACISLSLLLLTSACQLTEKSGTEVSVLNGKEETYHNNQKDFGLYYLELKSLSAKALREEVERQKQALVNGEQDARMNIALLYSLPASPIYNVYSAKTVLNKHRNNELLKKLGEHNIAFFELLKDQLNQHIKLIENYKVMEESLHENAVNATEIKTLEAENAELLKKIYQLQKIEKAIRNQRYQ